MLRFILKRIVTGSVMLFTVTFVTFSLLQLGAPYVARNILGVEASTEDVAALHKQLGLDRPFFEQFYNWLAKAVQLDLGQPWAAPESVSESLAQRIPVTLTLVVLTTILAALVSVILGTIAAIKGGWIDRLVQFLGLIGFAIPGFLVAFFLITFFAVRIQFFNALGYVEFSDDPVEWSRSVTLPVIALSLSGIASLSQQIRSAVSDALDSDYVRTLLARGLSFRRVVYKHVLRNAGGPALSLLGVQFVGMMGGAVIVEQIFAIPGLGPYVVTSTGTGDIPAVMGLVVTTALIVIVVNLIIDLISAALNPKVRLS